MQALIGKQLFFSSRNDLDLSKNADSARKCEKNLFAFYVATKASKGNGLSVFAFTFFVPLQENGLKRYHHLTLPKKIALLCLLYKRFLLRKHSKSHETTTKISEKDTNFLLMVIQVAHRMQANTTFLTFLQFE